MTSSAFVRSLLRVAPAREHELMARHTTFRIGGRADIFASVATRDELRQVVLLAMQHSVPYFVLGGGSNILVGDGGLRGLVIENRARDRRLTFAGGDNGQPSQCVLHCDSGASLSRLARHTAARGLQGLEWAAGIPGTVGGAVITNAGAFGGCMADAVILIEAIDGNGPVRLLQKEDLALGYRESVFSRKLGPQRWTILGAQLHLRPAPGSARSNVVRNASRRRASQPRMPSAGSVFKNPPDHAAGWLIEQAGLKGARIGGAEISPKHANFIVNRGDATAADVRGLIELAQARVWEQFGISLEPEIQLVGDHS